ncbi:hypothetical protein G4B88_021619 [Cannabis sativa]|uniref:Uncharacterized protein n=1 Tax=Cannabis sativa TaxID=3483 RepID=A0A7J6GIS6_CANSA|nr:hypothetical protein G4B88_021619 [Cannabis sativa]
MHGFFKIHFHVDAALHYLVNHETNKGGQALLKLHNLELCDEEARIFVQTFKQNKSSSSQHSQQLD